MLIKDQGLLPSLKRNVDSYLENILTGMSTPHHKCIFITPKDFLSCTSKHMLQCDMGSLIVTSLKVKFTGKGKEGSVK